MSNPDRPEQVTAIEHESEPAPDPTDAPDIGRAFPHVGRWTAASAALQVVAAVAMLVVLIVAPSGVSHFTARCGGALGFVGGLIGFARELSRPVRSWWLVLGGVAAAVAGGFVVADPNRWLAPIGLIVGVGAIATASTVLVLEIRRAERSRSRMKWAMTAIAAGAALAIYAEDLFEVAVVVALLLALATSAIQAGVRTGFVDLDRSGDTRRPLLVRWIDRKGKSWQRRADIYDQVFFEGAAAPARLGRFYLMMLFASVISAAGVIADSTAVVIGAMLVAPLISPMMGMGLALATGWPNRLARSTLVVLGGFIVAVGTGWLVAAGALTADLTTNSQIVSRSSPRVIDLIIAVAAGSAGAYAISHKDASSSLPGVAVAIALVPPLSVVGVTAEGRDWQQASGALLLFTTNLVAIILAGGAVFLLTGVVPLKRFAQHQHRVRTSLGAAAVLALLVVGALVTNGRQIAEDSLALDEAHQIVLRWLGEDSEFAIVSAVVDDRDVSVVLAGPGDPPDTGSLVADLAESLGHEVRLDLQWIPRQRVIVTSD